MRPGPIRRNCEGRTSFHRMLSRTPHLSCWRTIRAAMRPSSTRPATLSITAASQNARKKPKVAASCAVLASRAISRPAVSHRRRRSARSAPASDCGKAPRRVSTRPAASPCSQEPTPTGKVTKRPLRRSWPRNSVYRSRTSKCSMAIQTRAPSAWEPTGPDQSPSAVLQSSRHATSSSRRARRSRPMP